MADNFKLTEEQRMELRSNLEGYNKFVDKYNKSLMDEEYIYASGTKTDIRDLRDAGLDVEFIMSPKSLKASEKAIKSEKGFNALMNKISNPQAYFERKTNAYLSNLENAMMMTYGDEEWREKFRELIDRLGPAKASKIVGTHQIFDIKYVYHEDGAGRGQDIPDKQLEVLESYVEGDDEDEEGDED